MTSCFSIYIYSCHGKSTLYILFIHIFVLFCPTPPARIYCNVRSTSLLVAANTTPSYPLPQCGARVCACVYLRVFFHLIDRSSSPFTGTRSAALPCRHVRQYVHTCPARAADLPRRRVRHARSATLPFRRVRRARRTRRAFLIRGCPHGHRCGGCPRRGPPHRRPLHSSTSTPDGSGRGHAPCRGGRGCCCCCCCYYCCCCLDFRALRR